MLSKTELFKQWRGSNISDKEQSILKTALLISDYVNSVDSFEVIKANAETKYNDFDQYNTGSMGIVVFVKLFIDEAISQLPETAEKERALLSHSSEVISALCYNWKDNTKGNIYALIGNFEKLLTLDSIPFADKNQYKTFLLSSCMLSHIIKIVMADWKVKILAAAAFLDLELIKSKVDYFLLKIEERIDQLKLKQLAKKTDNSEPDPLKPAKDLLSKRYLKVLGIKPLINAKSPRATDIHSSRRHTPGGEVRLHPTAKPIKRSILESLAALETDIEKVSSGIFSLIEQKNKKVALEAKIGEVNKLLLSAEENHKKITGRKNFLDFIEGHAKSFQTLLDNIEEPQKQQLLEKIKQLKSFTESSDLSSEVIHGVNWVTSPITLVYRTATPQVVQDMITSTLPSTLDRTCKIELKQMANACLLDLRSKLNKKEHQIIAINNRFFNQDEELRVFIANESSERLAVLQKANDVMREAVQTSSKLFTTVKENSLFLHGLREKSQTLSEFVRLHDNFFVKISNFLAQYFVFFKTNTAKMIDDAAVWKNKIDGLVSEYQNVVDQGMLQIEHIPHLDNSIKIHIKNQFTVEEDEIRQKKQNHMNPNKRNVRLLMNNLSRLFATKSQPLEESNEKEQEAEKISHYGGNKC